MNQRQIEKFFKVQCWFDGISISSKSLKSELTKINFDTLKNSDPKTDTELPKIYNIYKNIWGEKFGYSVKKCKKEISFVKAVCSGSEFPVLNITFIFSDGIASYLKLVESDFPFKLKGNGFFSNTEPFKRFGDISKTQNYLDNLLETWRSWIPISILKWNLPVIKIQPENLIKFYK